MRPSVGAVYAAAARDHGFDVNGGELDQSFRRAWGKSLERSRDRGYACSDEILRQEWYTVVGETFRDTVPAERMPGLFDDLYDRFASAAAWELAPGVQTSLEYLRGAGLRLGVLSNWDSRLRSMLEDLGLARAFDFLVISCDVGVEKPHPDIFLAALDRAGTSPAQTLVVGDSYETDILAAARLGLATLWVASRQEQAARGGELPDVEAWIETLPEDAATFWSRWLE